MTRDRPPSISSQLSRTDVSRRPGLWISSCCPFQLAETRMEIGRRGSGAEPDLLEHGTGRVRDLQPVLHLRDPEGQRETETAHSTPLAVASAHGAPCAPRASLRRIAPAAIAMAFMT